MSAETTPTDDNAVPRSDTDVIGKRVGAQIIDLIVVGMLAVAIGFVSVLFGGAIQSAGVSAATANAIASIGTLLAILVSLLYNFVLEGWWNGQTVGKKLLGIKVVKENGDSVDPMAAFVRNVPTPFALSWLAYLVALLSMASSDTRQRLFDRLAGTVVIEE